MRFFFDLFPIFLYLMVAGFMSKNQDSALGILIFGEVLRMTILAYDYIDASYEA